MRKRRTTFPLPQLRAVREAAALTQIQAARLAQVSEATWSLAECGRRDPCAATRTRMAAALGVPALVLTLPTAQEAVRLAYAIWTRTGDPQPTCPRRRTFADAVAAYLTQTA